MEEEHPGHGPHWRLTYKVEGKTQTVSLTGEAIPKAEEEVAEFRRFQQLSREFVEINTRICQLRPVEPSGGREKKTAEAIQKEVAREIDPLLWSFLTICASRGLVPS